VPGERGKKKDQMRNFCKAVRPDSHYAKMGEKRKATRKSRQRILEEKVAPGFLKEITKTKENARKRLWRGKGEGEEKKSGEKNADKEQKELWESLSETEAQER